MGGGGEDGFEERMSPEIEKIIEELRKYRISHNCAIGRIIKTSKKGVIVSPLFQCNIKKNSWVRLRGLNVPQLEFEQMNLGLQYILSAEELWDTEGNLTEKGTWVEFEKIWDWPLVAHKSLLKPPELGGIIAFDYEIDEGGKKAQIRSAVPLNTPNCAAEIGILAYCKDPVYISQKVGRITRNKCLYCGKGLCGSCSDLCGRCDKSKEVLWERKDRYNPWD
jgi:hypothetical protein